MKKHFKVKLLTTTNYLFSIRYQQHFIYHNSISIKKNKDKKLVKYTGHSNLFTFKVKKYVLQAARLKI